MLLSLSDEVRISLRPDRVSIVRLHQELLRTKVVASKTEFCGSVESGEASWQPTLRALQTGLSSVGSGRMNATVILSNHFVRYVLIPWGNELSNDSEEQAYIRHYFSVSYGHDVDDWVLRLSTNGYGEMQVASAIDRGLLDGLERIVSARGLRFVSAQPYLMDEFNQWRSRFNSPKVWFVLAEQGRLCISLLEQGKWRSLRTMKVDDTWLSRLPQLLEREFSLSDSGAERGVVFLFAPEVVDKSALPVSGWTVNWLRATPSESKGIRPASHLASVKLRSG
ncbi:hypothetical protein [Methylotenera versatilis]|uniref:Uncharacterized protein n=1 Tax=Methylotenera versatilis (strain 301) TaxID=666681 RepID=D7DMD5_METV0|nr:hypothetical protein [Methylotenera versatilis]ADI28846.1 conserved hypothetical protein [Methylotenera versatilis 301]